jgi:LacI family transcriptional regulator
MPHPFKIREIAVQAGLSEATVDRVLNDRGGVRASTVQEVRQAIADLQRQRTQLRLGGRTFVVDVVVQAPQRFSAAVRAALEAELPLLRPAVLRARFSFRESGPVAELVDTLDRIGSAVERLVRRGIPVVTFVTDVPTSPRLAYVGIDNRSAGATAAYLVGQWLGDRPGNVLVTLSSSFFRGEEEREMGFRAAMRAVQPERALIDITESQGLDDVLSDQVHAALDDDPSIVAVYSIGGGNLATVDAFDALGRTCRVFIAHDLDADNLALLHRRRLSAVLHHDLGHDLRTACHVLLGAHRALPGPVPVRPSAIQVVTPFNVPAALP